TRKALPWPAGRPHSPSELWLLGAWQLAPQQVRHGVVARSLPGQIQRSLNGAVCKDAAAPGAMAQGQRLVRAAEQNLMFADDAASAHGADPQLLYAAFAAHLGAVIDVFVPP